jgi:hypothetical protein
METLYRKHIIIAIVLTIIFLASSIGLWQFGKRMKTREARVHEVKEQLATYNQNKKVFTEESAALRTIDARLGALESKRVTTANIPETLSSLEALAAREGITFTISAVQAPKPGADDVLTISFFAKGSALHLNMFLDDMLAQAYELRFTNYALTKEQQPAPGPGVVIPSEPQWQLLGSIEILSYSQ